MVVKTKEKKQVGMKELTVPRMEVGADRKALAQRSQEIAKAMWSGKLTINEQAMLNHICKAYGLDPLLKEIVVLGGNPYIEVGGMVRIANRDKYPPEGMTLRPATEEERKLSNVPNDVEYWCCELWKKGCNKPFVEFGEADKDTVNLFGKKPKDIRAMARTRAKGRALKGAYAINLPVFEEIDLSSKYPEAIEVPAEEVKAGPEEEGKVETPPEKNDMLSLPQERLIFAEADKKHLNQDQLHAFIKDKIGVDSVKELTKIQASEIIRLLRE